VSPSDINWRYIRNKSTSIATKRTLIFILTVLILFFITSPAVVVNLVTAKTIKRNTLENWVEKMDPSGKYFFKTVVPVLLIFGINELILVLIDLLGRAR
jgi:uncharacterized membrane protein